MVHCRVKLSAISELHKLHYRVQHHLLITSPANRIKKLNSKLHKNTREKRKELKFNKWKSDLESFVRLRRKQDFDEGLNELVELGAEPGAVYEVGVVMGAIGGGRLGGGGR